MSGPVKKYQSADEKGARQGPENLEKNIRDFLTKKYNMTPESIDSMLNGLTESLINEFNQAEKTLSQEDLKTFSRHAHSLKGALRNMGLEEWALRAHRIEKLQTKGNEDQLQSLAEQLQFLKKGLRQLM